MSVVSVINYKGGVGKTTLTANLGAELARRGNRVLLIDLDPQASLTFSFYQPEFWEHELADRTTILQWYGSVLDQGPTDDLADYLLTPPQVNNLISAAGGGRLDLIASHLGLVDVDLDVAAALGGSRFQHGSPQYLPLHNCLAEALRAEIFLAYDAILLDCAPNFTMVTRTGIVASDQILVPAKPDYLSTLGIDYLRRKLSELVRDYNKVTAAGGGEPINPVILGVVMMMIQHGPTGPLLAQRNYLARPADIEIPVFRQTIRESKTVFAAAGEQGIPAMFASNVTPAVKFELQELAIEFLARTRI